MVQTLLSAHKSRFHAERFSRLGGTGVRLYSITFKGYKRFADAWMNLDGRTIAIVGPNEAGKSSVLEALTLLNHDSPIPSTAITRGTHKNPDDEVFLARFRLTPEERGLAPWPLQDNEAIWLIVAKTVSGARKYRVEPGPRRDRRPREQATAELRRAMGMRWFRVWEESLADGSEQSTIDASGPALIRMLVEELDPKPSTLSAEVLDRIATIREQLRVLIEGEPRISRTDGKSVARLVGSLEALDAAERAEHPSALADRLRSRVPQFVEFDDQQRDLRSEYNLADGSDISSSPLRNLATMAGLPLNELLDAINSNDIGRLRTLQERAQRRIGDELREAWKQSPVAVSFDRESTILRITVSSHEDEFFSLKDRSDGMRMFLALRTFLAQQQFEVPPVLLVDEAETHLHYDAQADLIRVFEQQDAVSQVIYTTHSIGCLPQDLGRGVRVVTPIPDSTRSGIQNVWGRDTAGVSPLMLAMGASTVPLTPSRFVVIAEGPSDAMLLPSLLREATGLAALEFQVVAGLSEASDAELTRLDVEAPRVAYLVDGDQGGARLAARLKKLNIAPRKIVKLSAASAGLAVEDLIDPELYLLGLNGYLQAWPPHPGGFPKSSLKRTGRSKCVEEWCGSHRVARPSKLRVAEEILRILDEPAPSIERRIGDRTRLPLIRALHQKLRAALGAPN